MNENEPEFICPQPRAWHLLHQKLQNHYIIDAKGMPEPPIPLNLAGWNFSSDSEKAARWQETIDWAKRYGVAEADLVVLPGERYPRGDG